MDKKNITRIALIHLLGFKTNPSIEYFVFFILFVAYCLTICGNLLILVLVYYGKTLHSPMYFFLSQLSVSDILIVTDILPNSLHAILAKEITMSFSGCITQFSIFAISEGLQCFLLTVMAYDRYLAICKPLHYTSIMSHQTCWIMIIICWTCSMLIQCNHVTVLITLQFCGPNIIDHFFCDLHPILKLSCSDTTNFELEVTLLGGFFVIIPFFIIIVSYIYIIVTIFNIPSITGRKKVFSTCSSHLSAVSTFYLTIVCVYLLPNRRQSSDITKFMSFLYTVVNPLLNPIIYSLRNKDLKQVVVKMIDNFLSFPSR
uniref:G-protein coupled receptors family 1 profile domain-containing protein n=1 Tax=Pyxicephalus adspersus TaxID=30357 RepID=A0AAV3AW05_PYXAD|nr:TPA: hypothetical protein GDO54_005823 [Pyxicephalus adspersus]